MDFFKSLPSSKSYSIHHTPPHTLWFQAFQHDLFLTVLDWYCFNERRECFVPVRLHSSFSEQTILMPVSTCCASPHICAFVHPVLLPLSSPLSTPIQISTCPVSKPIFKFSHFHEPFQIIQAHADCRLCHTYLALIVCKLYSLALNFSLMTYYDFFYQSINS